MIEYKIEGLDYRLSYQDLKDKYVQFSKLSDEEFLRRLPEANHLAIMICFLKEIRSDICLNDKGIIHELAHLMDGGTTTPLKEIRQEFDNQLKLI